MVDLVRGLPYHGVEERMTRRFASIVLGSQVLVVFFGALVAYALQKAQGHSAPLAYLWVGIGLSVLCVVAAGMMRKPAGVTLGWVVQLLCLASAVVVPMMFLVGLIFGGLWITALYQGRKMDQLTRDFEEG